MPTHDIRLSVSFKDNRKRKKLVARLGFQGVSCLLDLWLTAAESYPTGVLTGLDTEDVELDANWTGARGEFVSACLDIGLLDHLEDGTLSIHDWDRHQPFVFHSEERSEQARHAINTRWDKIRRSGDHAKSCEQNTERIRTVYDENTNRIPDAYGENGSVIPNPPISNTPTPTPVPYPNPVPTPVPTPVHSNPDTESQYGGCGGADAIAPPCVSEEEGKRKPAKAKAEPSAWAQGIASGLEENKRLRIPNSKAATPNALTESARQVDLLHRQDGVPQATVIRMAQWVPTSNFWRDKVHTGGSLREKWDKLCAAMQETSREPPQRTPEEQARVDKILRQNAATQAKMMAEIEASRRPEADEEADDEDVTAVLRALEVATNKITGNNGS